MWVEVDSSVLTENKIKKMHSRGQSSSYRQAHKAPHSHKSGHKRREKDKEPSHPTIESVPFESTPLIVPHRPWPHHLPDCRNVLPSSTVAVPTAVNTGTGVCCCLFRNAMHQCFCIKKQAHSFSLGVATEM